MVKSKRAKARHDRDGLRRLKMTGQKGYYMKKTNFIGHQIRIAMAENEISGEELAHKIGCSRQALHQVMTGKRPGYKIISKIEDVLGVEFDKED